MAGFSANAKQMAVRLAGAIVTGLPDEEEKYAEASRWCAPRSTS